MHEVGTFLRGFPPFDVADDDALASVVAATEVEFFPEGALLLRRGEDNDGHVHVLRTGWVELVVDGRVFDVVGPGEMVGLPSLVSGLPPGVDARAVEDVLTYRVPEAALLPLLSGRDGLRFLARTVRDRTPTSVPEVVADAVDGTVGPLARRAVVVDADRPVADAVRLMHESDASSALVRGPDGSWGILTDHDLRTRVLAAGLGTDGPVGAVATAPVLTTTEDTTTGDAVITLLAHGIRHLPVLRRDGTVVGVVEDVDLLAAQSGTPVRIRRAITRADGFDALRAASRPVVASVVAAHRAGHPAHLVTTTLSTLREAVVAKAIELHLRDRGAPPAPFTWLVTGSVARREALPGSDLDSLLAWDGDDHDPRLRAWMRSFAADVLETLADCGIAHDDNGVRADDVRFSRSVDAWRAAVGDWSTRPREDQADIYLSALMDARPVWGHAAWAPVAESVATGQRRPDARSALHAVATHLATPTGFVRDFVIESTGEHAGTLDLKRGGLVPAVALGRYLAALVPGHPASTVDRVRAAGSRGLLPGRDADDLLDALEVVQRIRLDHQARTLDEGGAPDDRLRPDALTTLQRRGLRDAFRVLAHCQRVVPPPVARP